MSDPLVGKRVRRRRTWYRRRLRIQRTLLTVVVLLLLGAATWQNVARLLDLPRFHSSQVFSDSFWARGDVRRNLASLAVRASGPKLGQARHNFPYSVIPGGVRDVNELREVVARDYVVRRHYARFNYGRAQLIRAHEARLVYMSYRRGDAIFWTRKKVHLNPDELLLTDGVITARSRCGNQISETPQEEAATEEPPENVFDLPVAGLEPPPSLPFRSSMARPSLPFAGPLPLFAGNFSFPFVPFGSGGGPRGVCESVQQEQWEEAHGPDIEKGEKHCKGKHKRPVVPEPATLLLISSGLAGICWRYCRARRPLEE